MKKILKLVSVSILSCMMALCLIVPVSAEEQSGLYEVTIADIKEELSNEEIIQELINYTTEIKYELSITSDFEKKIQLTQMIESLSELLNYVEVPEEDKTIESGFRRSSQYDDEIQQQGYATGKSNAALIIAYFKNKGYNLSAELLTYATVNKSKNNTYYPTNGSKIRSSDFFNNLVSTKNHSGSSSFTGSNSNMDLYYAIHRFNYTYTASNKLLVISDYYDFAYEDNYGGLAGVAVRAMYNAQYYGAIVPYNVRIQQYK